MKRALLSGVLTIGLASFLLAMPAANAAGWIQKKINCPVTGSPVIPPGDPVELSDIVISSDGVTDVEIFWNPPKIKLLTVYLGANDSFSTNFQGQVEAEQNQGLKVTCSGTATLSILVTGTRTGF